MRFFTEDTNITVRRCLTLTSKKSGRLFENGRVRFRLSLCQESFLPSMLSTKYVHEKSCKTNWAKPYPSVYPARSAASVC